MKSWYLTRDNIANARHKGQELQKNKYILLSQHEADLHNKKQVVLDKAETPPKEVQECQFAEDFTQIKKNDK